MAKNIITTSEGNVRFEFPDTGKIINVHPNHIYTSFYIDTVSFMLIALPKSSGLAIMSSKAEDLEFDGQTYTFDQLPDVITEAFVEAGAQARWEVVDELPASGRSNTIYLVPKEEGSGFDEYIWLKDEQEWELIGDTDIELWRYLKKDDFNVYSAATKAYIDSVSGAVDTEIARATSAEDTLSGAIDTKLAISDFNAYSGNVETELNLKANSADVYSKSEVYTKSETDGLLDDKADLSALTEDERVWGAALNDLNSRINTVSGDVATKASQSAVDALNGVVTAHTANTNVHVTSAEKATWNGKQDVLVAGENITISGNVISAQGGGVNVVQTTGTSTTDVMSQDAVTTQLNGRQVSESNGYFYDVSTSYQSTSGKYTEYIRFNSRKNDGSSVNVTKLYFPRINGNRIIRNTAYYTNFEFVETSAITTSVTSASTDSEIPSAKAVYNAIQEGGGGGGTVDQTIISGSTNAVAGGAVYNKIDEVEQVTAAGLNALNDRLSEDEEVTAAGLNAVNDKFDGLKLKKLTQAEYDALTTKDSNTLYIVI